MLWTPQMMHLRLFSEKWENAAHEICAIVIAMTQTGDEFRVPQFCTPSAEWGVEFDMTNIIR